MEEKSVVGVSYGDNPRVQYSWVIPLNLYIKYLIDERRINIEDCIDVSAGHNRRYADRVGIVIKSFLDGQDYSLVLFGDVKIIIPNTRLYLQ